MKPKNQENTQKQVVDFVFPVAVVPRGRTQEGPKSTTKRHNLQLPALIPQPKNAVFGVVNRVNFGAENQQNLKSLRTAAEAKNAIGEAKRTFLQHRNII